MERIEITVVGAGVVGLAVAWELAKTGKEVFVLEKNSSFGQETSSRNSEVIHAGIYYPADSLKTRTCLEGRDLLYEFCAQQNLAHKRIGKLIVAQDENEIKELEGLFRHGLANGVRDLRFLSRQEMQNLEPRAKAAAAIFSPSTGIIDSHGLMKSLIEQFQSAGGQVVYGSELVAVEQAQGGFTLSVRDGKQEAFKFLSHIVINSAGLESDQVAGLAGLDKPEYRLKYCKGDYFRVEKRKSGFISHLVYPVPKKDRAGLGIHATLDLSGSLRLGPDDEYVERLDYQINAKKKTAFWESVRKFLPFVEESDLAPDTSGIRPKLQGPSEPFRDFVIKDETDNGLAGFINLIGIESPGLTAALSIAREVSKMAKKYT